MLFDLRGKRRRTVQITYAALAVLMGMGLIAFGVGSGTSGGLADIFGGGGGGSDATKKIEKRLKRETAALRTNPANEPVLRKYMEDQQLLAQTDFDNKHQVYGKDGKAKLAQATAAWSRYMATDPKKPSVELAKRALQTYVLLKQAAGAAQAGEVIAEAGKKDWQDYARLACYASAAGQTRKATLAGQHAVEIAPSKAARKSAQRYVKSTQTGAKIENCG